MAKVSVYVSFPSEETTTTSSTTTNAKDIYTYHSYKCIHIYLYTRERVRKGIKYDSSRIRDGINKRQNERMKYNKDRYV